MVEKGITVSLGSDTPGDSGFIDMVRTMYIAACAHKDACDDATIMGAYKALEMTTIDAAKACLWEDEIGSLERADVILVDRSSIEWTHPGRDPIRIFVYSSTGNNVKTVIIDGRIVMKDRVLTTVDEEFIKHEVRKKGAGILNRIDQKPSTPWPVQHND